MLRALSGRRWAAVAAVSSLMWVSPARRPLLCKTKTEDEIVGDDMLASWLRKLLQHMPTPTRDDFLHLTMFALPALVVASVVTHIAQKRAFEARHLTNRLNFSLNTIVSTPEGKWRLLRRTLREVNAKSLMPLPSGVTSLVNAANATEPLVSPFVSLPKGHRVTWTNQLVNEISSITAVGHIALDMGLPVDVRTYLMTMVVEQTTEGSSMKVRVLLIRKDVLASLVDMPDPEFEHPSYHIRWRTLLQMAAAYYPKQREAIIRRLYGGETKSLASEHTMKVDFDDVHITEMEMVLPRHERE